MQNARRLRVAILAAAAAILLAQAIATLLLVARAREAAMAAATDTVERVALAVEASINRNFVQVDAMLAGLPAVLASLNVEGRLDLAQVSRVLRELNNQNFTYRDVLLLRADGLPIATALAVSRRRPLPASVSADFADAGARGGSVAIGGPVQNPATGEWTLFFARHVTLPGHGPVTAVAEVPVPLIQSLMASGGEAAGLKVSLERTDGRLLASQPHDETQIGRMRAPLASMLPIDGQVVLTSNRTGGIPVLAVARATLYPNLAVSVTRQADLALAGWYRDRERALMVSGGFALLVIALAFALVLVLRQRERVENERTQARENLDNALESMSDGFVMFDGEDRLIACNSRYKDFYKISAPFIVPGARFEDIMREGALRGQYPQAGADIDAWLEEMKSWHRGNHPPMERLLPDGRWVLITERRTPNGGTVGIRTDITPLKQAMEELASARDAAAAAGEAKSQFLARMSHELRTPLNGVLGFAQVLLHDPRLAADQREQVRTLHEAGHHLLELVNGLLDLSKIEAGRLDLHLREVALRPLLEGCATLLRPEIERKRLRFAVEAAPGLPDLVEGDPTRLRQLLLNLLSNAVKFTPAEGRVDLRARRLANGTLRFEVEDSGPGVPADKQHLLFEDFVQLDPSPAPEAGGTGLGLAISARLATLMGGRIGCESAPGQGALFWVELPLREPAAPAPAPPPSAPAAAGAAMRPLRILVVDDVAANRMVARAMLQAAGHRVDLAVDGAEAVEAVLSESYDAVLMDVQMPIVDGLEATRRIRALPPPQNAVRVIAVTASALPDQVEACRAAGMDAHLAKPIDRAALLATLGGSEATAAPAPEAAAEALLDAAVLERLAEGLGQVAGEIVGEFVEEVRSAAALLADGATPDGPDFQRLRQAGHRLVGAGRTLGAIRLAAAAERLQAAARHGDAAASEAARQAALAAARETLVPLDAWLRRSGVAQALAAGG